MSLNLAICVLGQGKVAVLAIEGKRLQPSLNRLAAVL
jgi:hypothetical protein